MTQYNIFAVQARYEEGLVLTDEPIDRAMVVIEIQAMLKNVQHIIDKSKN